jgi:hypothetical protein
MVSSTHIGPSGNVGHACPTIGALAITAIVIIASVFAMIWIAIRSCAALDVGLAAVSPELEHFFLVRHRLRRPAGNETVVNFGRLSMRRRH